MNGQIRKIYFVAPELSDQIRPGLNDNWLQAPERQCLSNRRACFQGNRPLGGRTSLNQPQATALQTTENCLDGNFLHEGSPTTLISSSREIPKRFCTVFCAK